MRKASGPFKPDFGLSGDVIAECCCLLLLDSQPLRHLVVQEALAGPVRLDPFSVNDKLRDRATPRVANHFLGCPRRGLDIDFFVWDAMFREKALSLTAFGAPERGVYRQFHSIILTTAPAFLTARAINPSTPDPWPCIYTRSNS